MVFVSKPDDDRDSKEVDLAHMSYLLAAFGDVVLVDAYRVDPQKSGGVFESEIEEGIAEVGSDLQWETLTDIA